MICLDCGYIYDDATPFASLPSSYRCPVCRAPKRRFGPYNEPVPRNANDLKLRKSRKAKLQGGDGEGAGLDAYVVVVGLGGLGGVLKGQRTSMHTHTHRSDGKNIGIFVAAGAAVLGALYFVLNSQF